MNRREFLIYKFNKLIISQLGFEYRSTRWDRAYALGRYLHYSSNKFKFDFDSQKSRKETQEIDFVLNIFRIWGFFFAQLPLVFHHKEDRYWRSAVFIGKWARATAE